MGTKRQAFYEKFHMKPKLILIRANQFEWLWHITMRRALRRRLICTVPGSKPISFPSRSLISTQNAQDTLTTILWNFWVRRVYLHYSLVYVHLQDYAMLVNATSDTRNQATKHKLYNILHIPGERKKTNSVRIHMLNLQKYKYFLCVNFVCFLRVY